MSAYKEVRALAPGDWSDWQSPSPRNVYKMACCDCGLVHDMEFKVVRVDKGQNPESGTWSGTDLDRLKHRVVLRAKRNEPATAAMRREKRKKEMAKDKFNPGGTPGKLHREMGVPVGQKIPKDKLAAAASPRDKNTEKRNDAKRAETMGKWNKK